MRNRITGAMVAMAVAAAVSLTVMPLAGQAGRGQAPAGQGRGAAPAQAGRGTAAPRPDRIAGKPNLNGIWQALGNAYWNLEDHSASGLNQFWQLGAIAAGGESPPRLRDPRTQETFVLLRQDVYELIRKIIDVPNRSGWDDPALDIYNEPASGNPS